MRQSATVIANRLSWMWYDTRPYPLSFGETKEILEKNWFLIECDPMKYTMHGKDFIAYPLGDSYPVGRYKLPASFEELAELIETLESLERQINYAMAQ